MPKLYLVFLSSGNIRVESAIWLSKIVQSSKYELQIGFSYKEPIQANRNYIVQEFLKTDCTHLIMLDADTVPPDNFLDLVDLDKDVIGALYCGWKGTELMSMAFAKNKKGEYEPITGKGLLEVDCIGGGDMIIKREVLEKIRRPFEIPLDKEGFALLTEDFAFCEKVKKGGFKIWVQTDYLCNHFKIINLESVYRFLQKEN